MWLAPWLQHNVSKGRIKKFVKSVKCTANAQLTNRPVEGWDSIYRSMVTALISTSPRQVSKSSTEDSALPNLAVYCVTKRQQVTWPRLLRMPYLHKGAVSSETKSNKPNYPEEQTTGSTMPPLIRPPGPRSTYGIVTVTRMDSSLEAFSYNPTDGSFVALTGRSTTCTKCPNLRFLSYWAGFLS